VSKEDFIFNISEKLAGLTIELENYHKPHTGHSHDLLITHKSSHPKIAGFRHTLARIVRDTTSGQDYIAVGCWKQDCKQHGQGEEVILFEIESSKIADWLREGKIEEILTSETIRV
jgi:hypothetical protein